MGFHGVFLNGSFPMLSNFRGDVYTIQLELMVPHLGTMRRQED
jgi:hypothetical protein